MRLTCNIYSWTQNAVWILLNDVREYRLGKMHLNSWHTCLMMTTSQRPPISLIYLIWNVEALRWPISSLEEDIRLSGSSLGCWAHDLADLENECTVEFVCLLHSCISKHRPWADVDKWVSFVAPQLSFVETKCKQLYNSDLAYYIESGLLYWICEKNKSIKMNWKAFSDGL